jgi:hypothetical protein
MKSVSVLVIDPDSVTPPRGTGFPPIRRLDSGEALFALRRYLYPEEAPPQKLDLKHLELERLYDAFKNDSMVLCSEREERRFFSGLIKALKRNSREDRLYPILVNFYHSPVLLELLEREIRATAPHSDAIKRLEKAKRLILEQKVHQHPLPKRHAMNDWDERTTLFHVGKRVLTISRVNEGGRQVLLGAIKFSPSNYGTLVIVGGGSLVDELKIDWAAVAKLKTLPWPLAEPAVTDSRMARGTAEVMISRSDERYVFAVAHRLERDYGYIVDLSY